MIDLHEVVMKLVGPVQPVGETGEDERRLDNMRALTDLVDDLLGEIEKVEPAADRVEGSMRAIGVHAREFLREIGVAQ